MPHKLLLADDSVTIQRVVELTFADEDVQVIVAGDGRQAIDRIESERPDVVLADIAMPERDGYEVTAFVKGHPELAATPVLLLTGAFEPLDEDRARAVGCDGVLVKPFEPQVLINRVRELIAGRAKPAVAPSRAPVPVAAAHADRPAAAPEPRPAGAAAGADPLEEYFDRLDAAFASFGAIRPDASRAAAGDARDVSPDVDEPRAPEPAGDPLERWDPDLTEDFGPAGPPHLASAFAALLAAEQGLAPGPALGPPTAPAALVITDDLIDQIAERVIARMGDDSMRRVVTDTAERLVRQEIERIKGMSSAASAPPAG